MDPARWASVKNIFAETVDLDPAERKLTLDSICDGDPDLRREIEALLASNDEAEDFIEDPAFTVADAVPADNDCLRNKVIGHYRITGEIGRGGMGAVYLASRSDGEFEHQVAIKVVGNSFLGQESLDRFRRERQILARLNHPNIARLLDGGVTDDGLPYLVMEYVEGEPLVEYADKHELSLDERLRLFVKICRALAYAHGNLIVHRDIKPSNILVTADGEPKLLDFGLAKILDIESDHIRTATSFRALTPAYASPEQIRGDPITTASDIYSLGVVLYELLTGSRPFNYESMTYEKMLKVVSFVEPTRPSEIDTSGSETKPAPGVPLPSLKGDLDNVVMMALRKEPERRYGSAEQLAADIDRHLNDLPVTATPDTVGYRLSKFVQRNKVATAAAALIMIAVGLGLVTTTWQARAAARERDHARRETEKAEQLNVFLQSILSAASPEAKGKDAKVIEVLDDAAARLDNELADQPELKAKALTTIGRTYDDLGLPEKAEPKLREALAIYDGLAAADPHDVTVTKAFLAETLVDEYRFDEAEPMANEVVATLRNAPANKELAAALFLLGELRVREGKYDEAQSLLNESISTCDMLPGAEFECAYYRVSLGRAKQFAGDLDGAESIYRRSLAVFQREPARYAFRMGILLTNLGDTLLGKGDWDGSIAALSDADRIFHDHAGESLYQVITKFYLARAYSEKKDDAHAAESARAAVDIGRSIAWTENRNFIGALRVLGSSLTRLGKPGDGEPYLREALDMANKHLKPEDKRIAEIEVGLGECLIAKRRYAEAEHLLLDALEKQNAAKATGPDPRIETRSHLASLYRAWGRPGDARNYQ